VKYPSYRAYSPSGLSWLGDVPGHWETGNLRRFARMKTGHTPSRQHPEYWENCTIPWFGLADVWQLRDDRQKYLGETKEMISDVGLRNSAAELLPAGTVILSRTASVGFSGIMPVPMATTQDFWNWVCGPKLLPDYLLLLFRAMKKELERSTMGSTHKTIYQEEAAALCICVPPLAEQHGIVSFLEIQTGKIDALVDKKRMLVEKLKEERAALISRTVTCGLPPDAARAAGLDPYPKLRPTGIDGLDQLPEHWEMKPLKRAVTFIEGPGILAVDFAEEGVPLLRISGIGGRTATLEGCDFLPLDMVERRWLRMRVERGDLLISGSASTGLCSEVDGVTAGAIPYTGIIIVRPRAPVVEKDFIRWFFLSKAFLTQADLFRTGSTIQHFGPSHLSRMAMGVPSLVEQQAIADHLDRETARIDHLIVNAEAAIERLQEYRTALITAAVTGTIDVREVAGDVGSTQISSEAKLSL
jgi:type I restriction enzyme, S subunit